MSVANGADVFVWTGTGQGGAGEAVGRVTDFNPQVLWRMPRDKIGIAAIDSKGSTAFNGRFTIVGLADDRANGQIRPEQDSHETVVQVNTLSILSAERHIRLPRNDAATMVKDRFILRPCQNARADTQPAPNIRRRDRNRPAACMSSAPYSAGFSEAR